MKKTFRYASIEQYHEGGDIPFFEFDTMAELKNMVDTFVDTLDQKGIFICMPHFFGESEEESRTIIITTCRQDINRISITEDDYGLSIFEVPTYEEALGYIGDLYDGTELRYNTES